MHNRIVLCYKEIGTKMALMLKSLLTQLKVIEFLLTSNLKPIGLLIIIVLAKEDTKNEWLLIFHPFWNSTMTSCFTNVISMYIIHRNHWTRKQLCFIFILNVLGNPTGKIQITRLLQIYHLTFAVWIWPSTSLKTFWIWRCDSAFLFYLSCIT